MDEAQAPKKKKQKPQYLGIEYDSQEEIEFVQWLNEAKQAGLITSYAYHPKLFTLAEAVKFEDETGKHTLTNVEYTPDFLVYMRSGAEMIKFNKLFRHGLYLFESRNTGLAEIWIDVKGIPGFKKGQSANSSLATYPIKAAWVYAKYGIYINKIIARDMKVKDKKNGGVKITKEGFFSKTFVPAESAWMKARKVRTRTKEFENCKLIDEALTA